MQVRCMASFKTNKSNKHQEKQVWYLHEQARGLWEGGHGAGQVHGLLPRGLPTSGHEEQVVPGQGGLHGVSPARRC